MAVVNLVTAATQLHLDTQSIFVLSIQSATHDIGIDACDAEVLPFCFCSVLTF